MGEIDQEFAQTCERNNFAMYKRNYYNILKCISTTSKFTFSSPRPQSFSLPLETIFYIFYQKNSPYFLLKLYQTCKYFFKKCMILPIITPSVDCHNVYVASYDISREFNFNKTVLFWFQKHVTLDGTSTSVLSRIYACSNLQELYLKYIQLSLNEFNFLIFGSKIQTFVSILAVIFDSNNANIPLNIILEKLPYCTSFRYRNEKEEFSRETLLALNEIKFEKRFIRLEFLFMKIDKTFDAKLFWQFYYKNIDPSAICSVSTIYMIGEKQKEVENMLQAAHNTIFSTWSGKKPIIGSYIQW